jgi:hypothetical protein
VHLGWDVVSVAAGGGGIPVRPVQVEGTYTPPAYLLADSSGRLHTAGVDRQRPDLGIAISDVRDILGHRQIRIAAATWPVELVFRARLYNPLAATGKYLRGKPDVVAVPFPDDWPDEKVDEYCRLIELLDVATEPLPESVALSGYVRALGLVHPPGRGRSAVGATGVYSDSRLFLVVAVHGDDEQPTESVGVPIAPEAMRDAHAADNVVIEVMAAARSIGADTSTVLLTGNVCFNDALRLAFQNHLGHRLQVADHPMHALVLGAAHLLVTDSESDEEPVYPPSGANPAARQANPSAGGGHHPNPGPGQGNSAPGSRPDAGPANRPAAPGPEGGRYPASNQGGSPGTAGPSGPTSQAPGPGASAAMSGAVPTTRVTSADLPPDLAQLGSRFTRPPASPADIQRTTVLGNRAEPARPRPDDGRSGSGPESPADEQGHGKGRLWNRVKDNLFGAPTIAGAVALAAIAIHSEMSDMDRPAFGAVGSIAARPVAASAGSPGSPADTSGPAAARPGSFDVRTVAWHGTGVSARPVVDQPIDRPIDPTCSSTPSAINRAVPGIEAVHRTLDCPHLGIDDLHYRIPAAPTMDPGPPMHI